MNESATSWVDIASDSDFSLQNIPFGVFSPNERNSPQRCATAIGSRVVDLSILEEAGSFDDIEGLPANTFNQETLNKFVALPKEVWSNVRKRLQELLTAGNNSSLERDATLQRAVFYDMQTVQMHLPVRVGDYTDFYSSREHATNVGIMFRGKDNALQPNWLHLPVGYHGRSSTVIPSGEPVHRPCGQLQKDPNDASQGSVYGACKLLDFELEVAFVVGGSPNELGHSLSIAEAKDRIFGFCLMNDWSARDIQKFEYVPLGPFTAKNWATSISPWLVTTMALEEGNFMCPTSAKEQNPPPLPYLADPTYCSYDINLSVAVQSETMALPATVCQSNFRNLYWNAAQQLVHHSVTGCVMNPGDLLGSGTISGSQEDSFGSMLELSWKGSREVKLGSSGQVRKFLQDGDTVIMKGFCHREGYGRVGFGEVSAKILPATGRQPQGPTSSLNRPKERERYQDFKLYGFWKSSSSWRVRVALAAKGISYQTIAVNVFAGEEDNPGFEDVNPLKQVPVLEFTDTRSKHGNKKMQLSQSVAIIEFLDQAFPEKRSLFPKDVLDRAKAYQMIEVINSGTQPLQNSSLLARLEQQSGKKINAVDMGKEVVERGLAVVEQLVQERRATLENFGPFSLGTFSPSVVDAFLVPQIFNAVVRFSVNLDELCPVLKEIYELCGHHPWFQVSHPEKQPEAGT